MISVGNACRRSVCLLLPKQFRLRIHGNGRHSILLNDNNEYGSLLFQEVDQQGGPATSSTTESVSQASNHLKNHQIINQSSLQWKSDTNQSPHSHNKSKPKKYFNFDFNPDSSLDVSQKNELSSENSKSKKKSLQPCRASVHQLLHLAKLGHIQQAEKMLQQLEASDKFHVGTGLLVSLLGMYLAAEQLPPVLATRSRLQALYPHVSLSTPSILSLARLMLHHGQTSECIKLLADEAALIAEAADNSTTAMSNGDRILEVADTPAVPEQNVELKDNSPRITVYSDKLCHKLLMVPAAQGNVSATEDVLEALLSHHYTKPSRALLGPLVQARIASRDWDGAVSTLQRLAQEHKYLPCRPELMKELIRLKDSDRLQQVVELSAELLGAEHALLDLAVCFLECGDTDKAIELLKESKITLSLARLQYLCQYHARHRNTRCLRHLLTVVRSCCSPENVLLVCAHLIRVYDEKRESSKATELLQAEGITRQELPHVPGPGSQQSGDKLSDATNKANPRNAEFRS